MVKKVLLVIASVLVILITFNWQLVNYAYQQAKGQLSITFNTQPIEEILSDTLISDSVKVKIRIIQEARKYAFEELGLTESENYTTFYDQKGKVALWNLSASEPYKLNPKLWSFPILGSFPYKGFFDLNRAKEEMKELKKEGFDVRIRSVGGWSTLGWTTDPILSNMLNRSEGSLAELIIHELTHGTLFVKDDIQFNENLAVFIGEKGAVKFLNQKHGKNSEPYFEYIMAEEDSRTFRNQMLSAAYQLDSLYFSINDLPDSIKAVKKHNMIDQIINSIDTLHFHNSRYYSVFESARPNNAYFMSYLRYYSSRDSLETIYSEEYNSDLKGFIKGMKEYHNK